MLVLKKCPRGAFAGVLVSLRSKNNVSYLTISIPYEECTRNVLGDIHVPSKKILFCINSENEETFLDELEYIVTEKTNVPLENVYFSSWFVDQYVRKKRWKENQDMGCEPTPEEVKETIRQRWSCKK